MLKKILSSIVLLLATLLLLNGYSLAGDVEKIKEELEKLKKEVETLQKEKSSKLTATYKDGFIIKSEDENFVLRINGYVQPQFQAFANMENLVDDRFLVRRARVKFTGIFYKNYEFVLQPEFEAKDNILRDAYIDLIHFREAGLRMGQFKIPFSLESLRSSSTIETVERSMVVNNLRGMGKDRDIGVALHGKLLGNKVEYAIGVFNGTGYNTADTNDNKDIVGRLVFYPFRGTKGALEGLQFGGSFQTGKQDPRGFDGKLNFDGSKKIFSLATGVEGNRTNGGFEFAYTLGPGAIIGEYIISDMQRKNQSDLRGQGWYVQLSCLLTGQRTKTLKDVEEGVEAVFKAEQLDLDDNGGVPDIKGQTVNAYTFGINWYWNKHFKIMGNYVIYDIDNLKADGNEYKKDNPNAFLVRAQLKF